MRERGREAFDAYAARMGILTAWERLIATERLAWAEAEQAVLDAEEVTECDCGATLICPVCDASLCSECDKKIYDEDNNVCERCYLSAIEEAEKAETAGGAA